MKEIISSYPMGGHIDKHYRFRCDGFVCACKCDCDWLLAFSTPPQKKGKLCSLCKQGDHAVPLLIRYNNENSMHQ